MNTVGMTAAGELLYLSRADVAALGIDMPQVVAAVERAFLAKGRGHAVMPPKTTLTGTAGAFAQVMPAWLSLANSPTGGTLGVKLVTVFPGNADRGLPATNAVIVLADPQTGVPVAIMDGGLITALRTGASVGVAARHLAAPGVARIGVLGCGTQARTSVRALAAVLPGLREVRCHDVAPQAAAAFVDDARAALAADGARRAIDFSVCAAPADVCAGAGVVVSAITMTAQIAPLLGAGLLEPGALAVALDYDAAWSAAAMVECERFVTDDVAQAKATKAHGVRLREIPDMNAADLGEVVAGLAPGRTSPSERIFCLNLGIAAEDVVCASLAHARAVETGAGRRLPR